MHYEAKEDQRVIMAMAFYDNLQVLKELFSIMRDMSQTMMVCYRKKTRDKYGSRNRCLTLPNVLPTKLFMF